MSRGKKVLYACGSIVLWIVIWQLIAMKIDNRVFLPSPGETAASLKNLIGTQEFLRSIGFSLGNITKGFLLGVAVGILLAVMASRTSFLEIFFSLPIRVVKATPVASFTILALLWMKSGTLSILISFLMVLPVIYTNVLTGIKETDKMLLEMAEVFHVKWLLRIRYIFLPSVLPYLLSACSVAIGLAWKSGIAAEVIGIVKESIGNHLYQAKIYLEIPELFAWTIVTIIISILFEVLVLRIIKAVERAMLGNNDETNLQDEKVDIPEEKADFVFQNEKAVRKTEPVELITFSHVSKSYSGLSVLNDVSFSISSGKPLALMGQSGIGKTTMLRLILGLEKPDSGEIRKAETAKNLSVVFQEDRLCEGTSVYRNLLLVCRTKQQKQSIPAILKGMGLSACSNKRVSKLSGGMKRRVAIGRALLADQPVILLDEPWKGLDEETKHAVMSYTKQTVQGKAFFLITHEKEEAEFFDCEIMKTMVAKHKLLC